LLDRGSARLGDGDAHRGDPCAVHAAEDHHVPAFIRDGDVHRDADLAGTLLRGG
jgi:hypothetical protein